ncbi:MAG: PAS domain-containing protein, partial [Crocinitomicaceae bacterium]|nr:PAS domain-containing protein [Crocinitomicaceae bacterium]
MKRKQPLIDEILDHPSDALSLLHLEDLTIFRCNKNFENYFSVSEKDAKGKTVYLLSGAEIPSKKREEIISRLRSVGIYKDCTVADLHQFLFHPVTIEGIHYALLRICNHQKDKVIEQYKRLIEKNVAGVFQGYLGGNIITCNLAFARMLGFESTEEAQKFNATKFYPTKTDRESFLKTLRERPVLLNFEIKLRKITG